MKRKSLFPILLLGTFAAAPLAFAQDATQAQNDPYGQAATQSQSDTMQSDTQSADTQSQPSQPYGQASQASTTTTPTSTQGSAGASAKQVAWADLDADKDGKLSKTEASSLKSLGEVFDAADADHDGMLSADEYRAYLDAHPKSNKH
jgi:hypothetical protein